MLVLTDPGKICVFPDGKTANDAVAVEVTENAFLYRRLRDGDVFEAKPAPKETKVKKQPRKK